MNSITKICIIETCEKPRQPGRKSWCVMHYTRWRNHGDPLITQLDRSIPGITKLPEYKVWQDMKARCYYKKNNGFERYGGRGITVCDEWINSFATFYRDMGPKPSPIHSLDRIDNNGDYTPENCRWATHKEQSNNRRNNILFTIDGETKTLKQWCEQLNLKYKTVHARIKRGWTIESSLF